MITSANDEDKNYTEDEVIFDILKKENENI